MPGTALMCVLYCRSTEKCHHAIIFHIQSRTCTQQSTVQIGRNVKITNIRHLSISCRDYSILIVREYTVQGNVLYSLQYYTEPEFLNIQWRLKSRLFNESCLFKGQSVQQDLQWLQHFLLLLKTTLCKQSIITLKLSKIIYICI